MIGVLAMNVLRLAMFAVLLQGAAPQTPPLPPGTASIEGVVVKLGTNEPIAGADLELTGQIAPGANPNPAGTSGPIRAVTSGADGKFAFRSVRAGTYKLVAARIGGSYTPFEYGQRGPIGRGVSFSVADGEQKKDVRMEMALVGSISGRILDSDNRPVGHVAVMAFSPIYRNGERIVTMLQLVHSDDHGDYRLFSLTPGRYFVAARLEDLTRRTVPLGYYPPGRMLAMDRVESPVVTRRTLPTGDVVEETYRVLYYGGGLNGDLASPIDIGPGANVAGVDIPIAQSKVPSLHIRGKITASAGLALPTGARVVAVPYRYSADMIFPTSGADSNGAFDLAGAFPGKYYLTVTIPPDPNIRTNPQPPPQFGYTLIEVGEKDLEGLSVTATPPVGFSGKISIEGRSDNDPALAAIRVDFTPEPYIQGSPPVNPNATFTATGEFTVRALPQWDFYPAITTGLPANGYVKSVRMAGKDLLLTPLHVDGQIDGKMEVIIGIDASTLTGRVLDERQEPSVNVKVALIPDAPLRRRWDLYKVTATDTAGNFTLRTVPPGDYKVFAWEQADDNIWTVPEFLNADEGRGKSIHIGPSANEKVEFTVIPSRRR
ncbi:MAG TPA: carboxypeptidase-like regulatory domain-containing protein [Terriglobia bacterium]|nr:carboxypeptidase-like regulatory domain-containing protein [Terriglobia bacterium]